MAARIQDRASQLISERRVLDLIKTEQDQQQAVLDDEMESYVVVRREYLSAIRSRHGVELELWKIKEQKKECIESMEQMQRETQDLLELKEEVQSNWEELVNNVLADHHLKREIYRRSIQATIDEREEQVLQRTRQLECLSQRIQAFRKNIQSAESEEERTQEEIEELKEKEQEEDEEVSNLASQVRDMVAKVKVELSVFDAYLLSQLSPFPHFTNNLYRHSVLD